MSEFYFEAPTPDEINATYNDLTVGEFKELDDDAIEALRSQAREEWFAVCERSTGFDDNEWWAAREKTGVFHNFCTWRKYGIPDQDMSEDDFLARMYHYADTRRANNPEYGYLGTDDYANLTRDQHELTSFVMDEIWEDGVSWTGRQGIDAGGSTYQVVERLGVTYDDLVAKGILETYTIPPSILFKESTGYVLAGKFATHLFSLRYPPTKDT